MWFGFCISPLCEYIQFLRRFEKCWIESKKTLRNLQVSSFLKRNKKLVKKVLEDSNSLDFKNTWHQPTELRKIYLRTGKKLIIYIIP